MELTIEDAFRKAIEAHQAGRLQDAERLYRAILQTQPQHPDANHNLGVLAVNVGKIEDGLPFFKAALESNTTIEQFWFSYIDALIKLERHGEAQKLIVEAKEKGFTGEAFDQLQKQILNKNPERKPERPNFLKEQLRKLITLYRHGKLHKALDLGIQLSKQFPRDPITPNVCGVIFATFGNYKLAIENYQNAIRLSPSSADPYNNLGVTYLKIGDAISAITSFKKATQLQPGHADAYNNLGNCMGHISNYQDARTLYKKAIQLSPKFSNAFNNLGTSLRKIGHMDDAINHYNRAIELDPQNPIPYNNLGSIYADLGRHSLAISNFNEAISLSPIYDEAYANLGNSLNVFQKFNEALKFHHKAILLNPNNSNSYFNLAVCLKTSGEKEAAVKGFSLAVITNPSNASAMHVLDSMRGKLTKTAPKGYITELFDRYAHNFETHLETNLHYDVPKKLRILHDKYFFQKIGYASGLDLGCGTGLSGLAFNDLIDHMIGIDLSVNMLKQAEKKNIYKQLIKGDVTDIAFELWQQEEFFDIFICTDVLIYVGNCESFFTAIKRIARRDAIFLLSIEAAEGDHYVLRDTGRYAHSLPYIYSCAQQNDYKIVACEKMFLRKEDNSMIDGHLLILQISGES